MNNVRRIPKSEEGVALIVALMAVLVLSVLGTSLLFTTNTEDLVSHNYAAEVDALFAANSGLQVGIKHAMDDAIWDTRGLWADHILAIGKTSPGGTTSSVDYNVVFPGCSGPAPCLDSAGNITGHIGVWFYDLSWYQGARCSAARCTKAEWDQVIAYEPYSLPPDTIASWTETGPNRAAQFLPNGGGYRLFYQFVPNGASNAFGDARDDRIRILSVGQSGTAIVGPSGNYSGGTMTGTTERRSTRQVQGTYRVKDIGIWNNAFFLSEISRNAFQGNALIRGSVHIRAETSNTGDTVWALSGNAGMRNNYSGMDDVQAMKIPAPVPTGGGAVHNLESELRVRCGNVTLGGSAKIGTLTNGAAGPFNPGKGFLDGIYRGEPGCGSTVQAPKYTDLEESYDATGWGLSSPDFNAPYTDSCNPTVTFPSGYDQYLRGIPNTKSGIHSVDLTALGGTPLDGIEFRNFDNGVDLSKCGSKICPIADYLTDPVQYPATAGYTVRAPVVTANRDTLPVPRRIVPAGNPDENVDILADTTTQIVGVFKHISGQNENNEYCHFGIPGGGHGFLYIPQGAPCLTDGTGGDGCANTRHPMTGVPRLTAQMVWDYIDRNFRAYNTSLTDADINFFLGRAGNAAPNARINGFADVDRNGASNSVGGAGSNRALVENQLGRLLIWGDVYVHDKHITIGSTANASREDLVYMGRGSFVLGADNPATAPSLTVETNDYVISFKLFPCEDSLGLMSANDTRVGDTGLTNDERFMGAVYGARSAEVAHNSEITGAVVSDGALDLGSNGANCIINQVPDLARCLPPEMIGDWSFYVTRSMSWAEH